MHTYQLPLDLVRQRSPERPVALVRPRSVAVAAQWFQDNLKADVFYAVKANPSRWVIETLVEQGVNAFDVASLAEIELVRSVSPNARLAYHVQSLVAGAPETESVDAHGIQAFYTGLVARASNMEVRIDATADGVSIAATPVAAS